MKEWQKNVILKNLTGLLKNIICNVVFVSVLLREGVISDTDEDAIKAAGRDGDIEKTKKLLDILKTRRRGFEGLAVALRETSQSGALLMLLEGAEHHVPDKSAFEACGIEINCDEVLSKFVMFEGVKISLQELCCTIDSDRLANIITSCMDVDTYKKLMYSGDTQIPILVSNTVPKPISYYIPRTISLKSKLDPSIFHRLDRDVFLIEGIQLHQLTILANRPLEEFDILSHKEPKHASTTTKFQKGLHSRMKEGLSSNWQQPTEFKLKVQTDTSSNQIHRLTVRFILLQNEAHFNEIVAISKVPVHWIKYENESYVYIKSNQNGGTSRVQEFLLQSADEFSEDDFLDMSLRGPRCYAYLIYESPGMGKTILLAAFARKVKERSPQGNTVFISASKLVSMYDKEKELTVEVFVGGLAKYITNNKLGAKLQVELFNSNKHSVNIFIDGFDEIQKIDIKHAQNIITFILKWMKNFRLYVTTRPHYKTELEDLFGVSGYNILPFQEHDQVLFFTSYWNKEHSISITDLVSDFAINCIKTFNSTVSVEDRMLAGIPLQCKMLAELYLDEAREKIPTLNKRHFINSIYKMYKHYMDTRFDMCKYSSERKALYHFHVVEAINLIFPNKLNIACPAFTEKVYRFGIMENNCSLPNKPVFVHRSFAEFLAAEAILLWSRLKPPKGICLRMLTEFFLNDFFQTQDAIQVGPVWAKRFYHITVTRFFEIGLDEHSLNRQHLVNIIKAQEESSFYNGKIFLNLLMASLASESVTLFNLLLDLFLQRESIQHDLNFLSITMPEKYSGLESTYHALVNAKVDLGKHYETQYLVSISAKFCSSHLVKLVCDFLYEVSGKHFHEFEYIRESSPVYLALKRGDYHVVEYLLKQTSPVYFSTFYPLNAILAKSHFDEAAVIKQKQEIIELLLTNYPEHFDVNAEYRLATEYIPPPLLSKKSHLQLLKLLIKNGADLLVKQTNVREQRNILHLVSEYFSPESFHEFVKFIFDFDEGGASSLFEMHDYSLLEAKPIHTAAYFIELEFSTIELLKSHNLKLDNTSSKKGNFMNHAIAGKRSVKFLKLIIDRVYCLLEPHDCNGTTFLHLMPHYYSESDYIEIVEHLIRLGRQDIFYIRNNDLWLPIHSAVQNYEISEKTLHLFQTHSVDFNSTDTNGDSLLMVAGNAKKSLSTFKTLVSFGVDIMAQNSNGYNVAHRVAFKFSAQEFHDFVEYVLSLSTVDTQPKQIFEIRDKTEFESTPIHFAVGHIELQFSTLELLHAHNVKLDIVDGNKATILHYAVIGKRSVSFLKILIEEEYCNLDSLDSDGNTFLHVLPYFYSESDYIEILEHLIRLGRQDIFYIQNIDLSLPIHSAVQNYEISEKTLHLFRSHSVDFHSTDINGDSLLMVAARGKKSVSTLKTLILFGVDIMAQNNQGFNIAHLHAFKCSAEEFHDFVALVLSLPTDDSQPKPIFEIRDKTEFESTPIQIAVQKIELHSSTLELLHTRNVKLDIVDGKMATILLNAVVGKRSVSFLKFIIQKGYCSLESQTCDGSAFLHVLPELYGEPDYIEILEHLVHLGRPDIFLIRNNNLRLPIHFAVYYYEISEKTLHLFRSHSVDFHSTDINGDSLLMVAARSKKSVSTLKTLVSFGVDIMAQNNQGFNIAHLVALKYTDEEFYDFVEFVLSLSTDNTQPKQIFEIRDKTEYENTPIHIAVQNIELQFPTLELLHLHIKLDIVDGKNRTILQYAVAAKRSVAFLKFIIDKGYCHLESQDCNGDTFLHYLPQFCSESDYIEILEHLIHLGRQDIFHIRNNDLRLPIYFAVQCYEISEKTLNLFQTQSVDLNSTDTNGISLLMVAYAKKSLSTLKTLVSFGVDIMAQNSEGFNVAHIVTSIYSADEFHNVVEFVLSLSTGDYQPKQIFEIRDNTEFKRTLIHTAVKNIELDFSTLELLHSHNVKLDIVNGNNATILHHAVVGKRSVSFLKFIIDKGYCPLDSKDCDGSTFLHYLPYCYSELDYIEILEHLIYLERQDIFHIRNNKLWLPILTAVFYYEISEKTLSLFQTHSVDLNSTDANGDSLLMVAAGGRKSLSTLKTLVSFGVDIMAHSSEGFTTAHSVASQYSADEFQDFVEFVLSLSADDTQPKQIFEIKDKTEYENTPIHIAVGNIELNFSTLELLHTHNVKLDIVDGKKATILHHAVARKRSVSFLKFLIDKGYCPLVSQDCNGDTFLHILPASYSEHDYLEILEYLVKTKRTYMLHSALLTLTNNKGKTVLHTAVSSHEVLPKTFDILCGKMVRTAHDDTSNECSDLIDSFCDINALTLNGYSVLLYAIRGKRSLNLVKELISRGADRKHRTNHNSTALLLAAQCGLLDHVEYFIELGSDIHEMDNDGDNALHCAVLSKNGDVFEKVTFLILKGAKLLHKNKKGKTPYMVALEVGIEDEIILSALQTDLP